MEEFLLIRRPKVDPEKMRAAVGRYVGGCELDDVADIQQLMLDLGAIRTAKRISQRQVARRMQTQQSAVSDLENGKGDPQVRTMQSMARAIGSKLRFSIDSDIPQLARFIDSRTYTTRTVPFSHVSPASPQTRPLHTSESIAATQQPSLNWAPIGRIPVRIAASAT